MSYSDPYAEQYGSVRYQHQPQDSQSGPEFNPYTSAQPRQTYGQRQYDNYYNAEYSDKPLPDPYEPEYNPQQRSRQWTSVEEPSDGPSTSQAADSPVGSKTLDERSAFERGEFTPQGENWKSARNLRSYRNQFRGKLWTKGGRGRCVGRFCCCTLMVLVVLFISIFLTFALWIRPPNISINGVVPVSNGSTIQQEEDGLSVHLGVNISVQNPNSFAVDLQQIKAQIFYPINNTAIGGGSANNIVFGSKAQTNFTFPFTIDYKISLDPKSLILVDLATKCGVLGTKTNIKINYKITLGIRILLITFSPVVSNSFSFMCPLDPKDIEGLLKTTGINPSGLVGS